MLVHMLEDLFDGQWFPPDQFLEIIGEGRHLTRRIARPKVTIPSLQNGKFVAVCAHICSVVRGTPIESKKAYCSSSLIST